MKVYIGNKLHHGGTFADEIDSDLQYAKRETVKAKKKKSMPREKKKCLMCGKVMLAYQTQKYCSSCAKKHNAEKRKERYRDKNNIKKSTLEKRRKKVEDRMKSIDKTNNEARKLGMSYGKYVAFKKMGWIK